MNAEPSLESNIEIAIASFRLIETGDRKLAHEIIGDDFVNLEAMDDPDQPDRDLGGIARQAWYRLWCARVSKTERFLHLCQWFPERAKL